MKEDVINPKPKMTMTMMHDGDGDGVVSFELYTLEVDILPKNVDNFQTINGRSSSSLSNSLTAVCDVKMTVTLS